MVRSFQEEIEHRDKLRKKYFEDPSYRKWSDVVDNGLTGESYGRWRDDRLFDYLITGQVKTRSSSKTLRGYLDSGHTLPINWNNFYAYFDEQLNDPENALLEEIVDNILPMTWFAEGGTVKELLDEYRDKLIGGYDII